MKILLSIIGPSMDLKTGIPILKEEHEKKFIQKLSAYPFFFILHQSLLRGLIIFKSEQSLFNQFSRIMNHKILLSQKRDNNQIDQNEDIKELTPDQKKELYLQIIDKGYSYDVIQILNALMKIIMDDQDVNIKESLTDYIFNQSRQEKINKLSTKPIENIIYEQLESLQSILKHKNKQIILTQIPSLHNFLSKPDPLD